MTIFTFGEDNASLAERLPTPDLSLLFTDMVTACDKCEIFKLYIGQAGRDFGISNNHRQMHVCEEYNY
jgi:hypothetical protein